MPHVVCVLGGTGFIGSALVARLAADGHAIKVLSRDPARHRELSVLPTLQLKRADVHDRAVLEREFSGCDRVVNLVGILNERGFGGRGFRRVHTELTASVVAACRARGVTRYLHMSALCADAARGPSHYLRSKGAAEDIVRRDCAAGRAPRRRRARGPSHYLRSKGAAEDIVRRDCAAGPQYVIFRPSVVFGPGDSLVNRFARLLRRMPGVFPLACADARFAPAYVGDVVEAFVRTIDGEAVAGRSFELCGPDVLTLAEIVRMTARAAGLRRAVLPLPRPIARLQAAVMDFVPGRPFSTDNFRSALVDSVCSSNGFAELGIAPLSLRAMIRRSLR